MRIKYNRGFTLSEMAVSVAVFSFLTLAIYGVLDSGNRLWSVIDVNSNNYIEARRAIMDMEREIRGAAIDTSSFLPAGSPPYLSLQFTLNGEAITYSRDLDTDTNSYYLKKTSSQGARRLAGNIHSVHFVPLPNVANPAKVVIVLNLAKQDMFGRQLEFSLTQALKVRN